MTSSKLQPGDRVLVTRLDYLGDVILSLPLVDALMARHPDVEIDYMTRRPGADLIANDPRFAQVLTVERNAGLGRSLALVMQLRRRRYRAVIDLYSNPRSAWLTWLTGAPIRIGGDRRGRRLLYTDPIRVQRGIRSAIDHHLAFGSTLGVAAGGSKPALSVTPEEKRAAEETLLKSGAAKDAPRIGIHPGGKWAVKRWPTSAFAELVDAIITTLGACVVVFTGPDEQDHTQRLSDILGEKAVYLDVMPVRDVAATLSVLDAFVACDGGIMHTSVAVGTPTVGIFGSSEPDIWFPYEDAGPYRAAVVPMDCRPCHRHECPLGHTDCLQTLTADMVLTKLRDVLARREVTA